LSTNQYALAPARGHCSPSLPIVTKIDGRQRSSSRAQLRRSRRVTGFRAGARFAPWLVLLDGNQKSTPPPRQWRRVGAHLHRPGVVALIVAVTAYVVLRVVRPASLSDFKTYRIEGFAVRHGWDLYGHLPGVHGFATYPPFAAMLFVPVGFLPLTLAEIAVTTASIGLLVWVLWTWVRLIGLSGARATSVAAGVAAVFLWSEPVFTTLRYGQINMVLLALVIWDFSRPSVSRTRGVAVGLAAAIKVTPGIFIVYLLLTRRWRFALTAIVSFAVTIGASLAVDARDTRLYWTRYLLDVHRVGRLENAVNQTIRGLLVRADHTRATRPSELVLVLLVLVAGLACAVLAHRNLGDRWGLPAAAVTGLLVSPISWSHHWVWCAPIAALIWIEARHWFAPTVLVFCSFAVWAIPHRDSVELHFTRWQIALSGWYVLFGLAFLGLTALRATTARRERVGSVFLDHLDKRPSPMSVGARSGSP
jgi:alpha-1,2-mannosyltransferase